MTFGPNEGQGGVGTFVTDNNYLGTLLYDNSGETGKPLYSVFGRPEAGSTSYFEPGLAVKTWGQALGTRVSG